MQSDLDLWRRRIDKVAGSTSPSFDTDRVGDGERWYVERVAVRDVDTANADCLVSVVRGATTYPAYYFKDIPQNEWESIQLRLWLFEGEYLRFSWSGVVTTDELNMVIHGIRRF